MARFTCLVSRPFGAFVALAAACGHAPPPPADPPPQTPFTFEAPPDYPPIAWIPSPSEARARAAEEKKPMIVFVRAAWSKGSVVMDQTIWRDSRVLAEASRFVALRVDMTDTYGKSAPPPSLAEYAIESIPTTLVVSSDGRVIARFAAGVAHPAEVAKALHEAQ
jgi:thiol:disulfide interchange protein